MYFVYAVSMDGGAVFFFCYQNKRSASGECTSPYIIFVTITVTDYSIVISIAAGDRLDK